MPKTFDNIELRLLPALKETVRLATRADLCVGYFNLRGWRQLDEGVERFAGGEGATCGLMVGMQSLPQDELRAALRLANADEGVDNRGNTVGISDDIACAEP